MLVRSVTRLAAQALLFQPALLFQLDASQNAAIPSDLSDSFVGDDLTLQVAYTGDPSDGFASGTKFTVSEASKAPNYALGDASGISSVNKYVIAMFDTSCDSARTLHFLQADFLWSGTETDIASGSKPLVAYQAPGAFQETGNRQYTYLMYDQPDNLQTSDLPSTGSVVVVVDFQKALGLDPPVAGVGMVVDMGGSLNCNQNAAPAAPQPSPAAPSAPAAPPAASAPAPSAPAPPAAASPQPYSAAPPSPPTPPTPGTAAPAPPPAASAPAPDANPPANPPAPGANPPAAPGTNMTGPAAPSAANPTVALPNATVTSPAAVSTGGAGSLRGLVDSALVASILGFAFAAAIPCL